MKHVCRLLGVERFISSLASVPSDLPVGLMFATLLPITPATARSLSSEQLARSFFSCLCCLLPLVRHRCAFSFQPEKGSAPFSSSRDLRLVSNPYSPRTSTSELVSFAATAVDRCGEVAVSWHFKHAPLTESSCADVSCLSKSNTL